MARHYKILYTDYSPTSLPTGFPLPAETYNIRKAGPAVTINPGKRKVVVIPTGNNYGQVNYLAIKQVGGTNVPFKVHLIDTVAITNIDSNYEETWNSPYNDVLENYYIFGHLPTDPDTPAGSAAIFQDSLGRQFFNGSAPKIVLPDNHLYLIIVPTSASSITKWNVSVIITLGEVIEA